MSRQTAVRPPVRLRNEPSNAPSHAPNTRSCRRRQPSPRTPPTPRTERTLGEAVDVGGPTDARAGFSVEGHGAPPPPRERGWGWNDGPPPGGPPRNWEGPPPPGGWNGPPPPGGWNRRWDGPPRDVVVAQADFGPFSYNEYMVIPTFNWMYGGWGYWYFGVWVPLY